MSVTLTTPETVGQLANRANPNQIADILHKMQLATMMDPVKITVAGIAALAAIDLTALKKGDGFTTINSGLAEWIAGQGLPAILAIKSLRVTASFTANTVGSYVVTDDGGTGLTPTAGANVGIAKLSDDGKTLTFLTTITGFVIEYIPRAQVDFASKFATLPS